MTDAQQPIPPEEPSPFIRWLRDHLDGETLEELDEGFKEICSAADISGRKCGLTFTVGADKKGRTLAIKTDVSTKIPPPPREADIFYPDRDGNLHRADPNAPKLPFNVVTLDPEVPRTLDQESGEIKTLEGGQS